MNLSDEDIERIAQRTSRVIADHVAGTGIITLAVMAIFFGCLWWVVS